MNTKFWCEVRTRSLLCSVRVFGSGEQHEALPACLGSVLWAEGSSHAATALSCAWHVLILSLCLLSLCSPFLGKALSSLRLRERGVMMVPTTWGGGNVYVTFASAQ